MDIYFFKYRNNYFVCYTPTSSLIISNFFISKFLIISSTVNVFTISGSTHTGYLKINYDYLLKKV